MAVLTEEQRSEVWAEAMSWLSANGISVSVTKAEMAEVVGLLDAGIGDSVGMVDTFLGPTYANEFDTATKFRLFALVVARRIQEGI